MIEVAKFNKRVFSYLIDFVVACSLGSGAGVLLFLFFFNLVPWYFLVLITMISCYLIYLLINIPLMYLSHGHTIGSLLFGIKTVKTDGSNITINASWVKNLYLGLVPFTIANAIYMLIIHTEKSIFDRITNIIVIDVRNSNFTY